MYNLILLDRVGSETNNVRSLLQHQDAAAKSVSVPPKHALDVHASGCVHQTRPLAPICGKPVVNQLGMAHGWLCREHLR